MIYTQLDPQKIVETAELLQKRIYERFPKSGLNRVSLELILLNRRCNEEVQSLKKPAWLLRLMSVFLVLLLVYLLAYIFHGVSYRGDTAYLDLIQALDAAMNSLVMIGAGLFFLFSVEKKLKRSRALKSIHALRSVAHVIDMHQLSKDPERFLNTSRQMTSSSPQRAMTAFELTRYLDYCSELLSIISKIAALYPQYFNDRVVLNTVDDVESLSTGLSRKIWQKITILNSAVNSQIS